jgi:ATP-dependent RNA helicase RhlE
MTFHDLKLEEAILEGLDSTGFTKPTPIQEQAIPAILEGNDIIACAQTGTGKTAAYLLPVINDIIKEGHGNIHTLILAPTRELAQQIDQQIEGLSYFTSVSNAPIYGGGDGAGWDKQKRALIEGSDIITATPGRLISFLATSEVNFEKLRFLVLDEADRMLDMGFFEDILRIVSYLPKNRQTLLFSATMPQKIRVLAQRILNEPKEINIAISKPAEGIQQLAYMCYDGQKDELVRGLLAGDDYKSVIIFASTKEKVKKLASTLQKANLNVKGFSSDLEQLEREDILRDFTARNLRILVGTDVLSRGIDVEGIDLVVNYDVPGDPADYVHRIGRTARAERTGTAITLINDMDQGKFSRIEALIGREIPKLNPPEHLGAGPVYDPKVMDKKGGGGPRRNSNKRRPHPPRKKQ